jgi:hypothetical protein
MTDEENIQEMVEEELSKGFSLFSLEYSPGYFTQNDKIVLKIEDYLLPFIDEKVHFLSPHRYLPRHALFMYVQELISMFSELKEEGQVDSSLLAVVETILLGMDYLTHESFIENPFKDENREDLYRILEECFQEKKRHSFSKDANRPLLYKAEWIHENGEIYCIDKREKKTNLRIGIIFKKTKTKKEFFKNVAMVLNEIDFKPNLSRVSYQEAIEGMTEHRLHVDLVFHLNQLKTTLLWLLNSTSWRTNSLKEFDKIDIQHKLGL